MAEFAVGFNGSTKFVHCSFCFGALKFLCSFKDTARFRARCCLYLLFFKEFDALSCFNYAFNSYLKI